MLIIKEQATYSVNLVFEKSRYQPTGMPHKFVNSKSGLMKKSLLVIVKLRKKLKIISERESRSASQQVPWCASAKNMKSNCNKLARGRRFECRALYCDYYETVSGPASERSKTTAKQFNRAELFASRSPIYEVPTSICEISASAHNRTQAAASRTD